MRGPFLAWLGLQGKASLLVEPGGFHVLHVVVLDLAEDPDSLLSPLDFQWRCREDTNPAQLSEDGIQG